MPAENVTLYRDADYGALAVMVLSEGGLEILDHGFMDMEPVAHILEAQADPVGESTWQPRVHKSIVCANIDRVLREGGYSDDPLGERAILAVDEAVARAPDLPAAGRCRVSEAVERATTAHLNTAMGAVGLPGDCETAVVEAMPRPNARTATGRLLPFFRARAIFRLPEGQGDLARDCKAWRAALAPLSDSLVRASVHQEDGLAIFEAGICPPEQVLEAFESAALPAFEQHPITGSRDVHIHLAKPMAESDLAKVRDRALSCTAATDVSMLEGERGVLHVRVPSTHEGDHLADPTFRERLTWLMHEASEWGAELGWVGRMEEKVAPDPKPTTVVQERAEVDILADALKKVRWARVTGRDEIEVALGPNTFLYLDPNGTWRTNGLHLL